MSTSSWAGRRQSSICMAERWPKKLQKHFLLSCLSWAPSREGTVAQQQYLTTFLGQWVAATEYGDRGEANETHVCGDMNIDVFKGRWLDPNYSLINLSKLIKETCDLNNFHQLVKDITRVQFRCSEPEVVSFDDSDHDLIGYTRYSKNPSFPARVTLKRSY